MWKLAGPASARPGAFHFASDGKLKTGGANRPARNIILENWMPAAATLDDFEALLNESFELETPGGGDGRKGPRARDRGRTGHHRHRLQDGRPGRPQGIHLPGKNSEIAVGDTVEVYLDRVENARGEAVLSREKEARREEAWDRLEKAYEKEERVEGAIFGRVKGGFSTVDLGGAGLPAGLPGRRTPGA